MASHPVLLDIFTLHETDNECKFRSSSLCSFPHPPFPVCLNVHFGATFSNTAKQFFPYGQGGRGLHINHLWTREDITLSPAAACVFLNVSSEASTISRASQHRFKLRTRILYTELHQQTASPNKKLNRESEKTNISQS
jgi:hypothetical protein